MAKIQLGIRISEEHNVKLRKLVEYYNKSIKIGKVTPGEVVETAIDYLYEKLTGEFVGEQRKQVAEKKVKEGDQQ